MRLKIAATAAVAKECIDARRAAFGAPELPRQEPIHTARDGGSTEDGTRRAPGEFRHEAAAAGGLAWAWAWAWACPWG